MILLLVKPMFKGFSLGSRVTKKCNIKYRQHCLRLIKRMYEFDINEINRESIIHNRTDDLNSRLKIYDRMLKELNNEIKKIGTDSQGSDILNKERMILCDKLLSNLEQLLLIPKISEKDKNSEETRIGVIDVTLKKYNKIAEELNSEIKDVYSKQNTNTNSMTNEKKFYNYNYGYNHTLWCSFISN